LRNKLTCISGDDSRKEKRPWEENDGYYGILSRLVKNLSPTFIFVNDPDAIDHNHLSEDQMINHFKKSACFTTKVKLFFNVLIYFEIFVFLNLRSAFARLLVTYQHAPHHTQMNSFQDAIN
jgi:hypothetical protein